MNQRKGRVFLLIWLSIPVLMIAGLMYAVAYWIDHGPLNKDDRPPPKGAGAGDTGGANAIGEMLRDRPPADEPPPAVESGEGDDPDSG